MKFIQEFFYGRLTAMELHYGGGDTAERNRILLGSEEFELCSAKIGEAVVIFVLTCNRQLSKTEIREVI